MQKVLRKRILRDLKENLFRYLALSALIIFVMYLVVSIVVQRIRSSSVPKSRQKKISWKTDNSVYLSR